MRTSIRWASAVIECLYLLPNVSSWGSSAPKPPNKHCKAKLHVQGAQCILHFPHCMMVRAVCTALGGGGGPFVRHWWGGGARWGGRWKLGGHAGV